MRFKITCEVSETELMKLTSVAKKIIPLYKSQAEAVDIDWIHQNKDMIIGTACTLVWDKYCEDFTNDIVLSKNTFYKLVKRELGLKNKMVRVANDAVRYCFTNKST